jgi:hypothetical protein
MEEVINNEIETNLVKHDLVEETDTLSKLSLSLDGNQPRSSSRRKTWKMKGSASLRGSKYHKSNLLNKERSALGACFRCGSMSHWAKDCKERRYAPKVTIDSIDVTESSDLIIDESFEDEDLNIEPDSFSDGDVGIVTPPLVLVDNDPIHTSWHVCDIPNSRKSSLPIRALAFLSKAPFSKLIYIVCGFSTLLSIRRMVLSLLKLQPKTIYASLEDVFSHTAESSVPARSFKALIFSSQAMIDFIAEPVFLLHRTMVLCSLSVVAWLCIKIFYKMCCVRTVAFRLLGPSDYTVFKSGDYRNDVQGRGTLQHKKINYVDVEVCHAIKPLYYLNVVTKHLGIELATTEHFRVNWEMLAQLQGPHNYTPNASLKIRREREVQSFRTLSSVNIDRYAFTNRDDIDTNTLYFNDLLFMYRETTGNRFYRWFPGFDDPPPETPDF